MSPLSQIAFLIAAGGVAGALGSAGAITSLVSYPALLVAGVPALSANVVNIVAGTALWPGSALTSGPELDGRGSWLMRRIPFAAVGAAVGVTLLLETSPDSFAAVVPYLVAVGSLTLLLSPLLTARRPDRGSPPVWKVDVAIVLVSVYSGYFGAGSGIMTLTVMLVAVSTHLPTANALKNMLIGAGSLIATATLIVLQPIDWMAVAPLAAGMLLGSTLGPHLVRRVSPNVARPLVATLGLVLAAQLWLGHGV
jgi:uncharacterized membrane protein YfcA